MAAERIYYSNNPDLPIPTDQSLHQFITRYNPDDIAADKVIFEDLAAPQKTLTYGGLREKAAVIAGGLTAKYGLKQGNSVAIIAANSVDWALLAHSIIWFGGVCVGTNHLATEFELQHYLRLAAPSLIVVDKDSRAKVTKAVELLDKSATRIRILVFNGDDPESSFPECASRGQTPIPPLDLSRQDNHTAPACLLFSSGTTGKPKAVILSHHNLIAHMWIYRVGGSFFNNGQMVEVFFPPFAHMLGLLSSVLGASFWGSHIVVMKRFKFNEFVHACAQKRATVVKIVPSVVVAIVKDPEVRKLDLTSLRYIVSSAAALQPEIISALNEILGTVDIVQGYGMSESAVAISHPSHAKSKPGSVGRLHANVRLRLVDEQMNDVPVGTPGEALVKSPFVFMHYRGNPQATKESFYDGWLRTGDSLSIDRDGHLWFHDRKKEIIKYKGNQVAPAELEGILQSHDDVLDAAVTAIYDNVQRTELPIGYVTLKAHIQSADRERVLQDVQSFLNTRVSAYKRLRGGLHHLDAIPKNATGKVMRNLLPCRIGAANAATTASGSRPTKL